MPFISATQYLNGAGQSTGIAARVDITVADPELRRLPELALAIYLADGRAGPLLRLDNLSGTRIPETDLSIHRIDIPSMVASHTGGPAAVKAVALIDAAARPLMLAFAHIDPDSPPITAINGPARGATSAAKVIATDHTNLVRAGGAPPSDAQTGDGEVVCLTGGTLIATPDGPRVIDDLAIGDLVDTWDGPPRPIRMIHRRTLSGPDFLTDRRYWPVCIQAGALGFGLPRRALRVGPQHRMLYQHIRVPLLFGEDAVFVRAKSMAARFEEVYIDSSLSQITYFHLVFDRHEVIFAEGAATESFHPGAEGVASLSPAARAELFSIFPDLRTGGTSHDAAFTTLRSWELSACVA